MTQELRKLWCGHQERGVWFYGRKLVERAMERGYSNFKIIGAEFVFMSEVVRMCLFLFAGAH